MTSLAVLGIVDSATDDSNARRLGALSGGGGRGGRGFGRRLAFLRGAAVGSGGVAGHGHRVGDG